MSVCAENTTHASKARGIRLAVLGVLGIVVGPAAGMIPDPLLPRSIMSTTSPSKGSQRTHRKRQTMDRRELVEARRGRDVEALERVATALEREEREHKQRKLLRLAGGVRRVVLIGEVDQVAAGRYVLGPGRRGGAQQRQQRRSQSRAGAK